MNANAITPPAAGIPDSPSFTIEVKDEAEGLEAYVCIHSIGEWGSSGGMRCVEDVTRVEVELLAKAMTFKFAFFGIPQGGAKAGLRLPYDAAPERRERLIRAVARHLEPLVKRSNLWSMWTDMNFYADDLRIFLEAMGMAPRWTHAGNTSTTRTAITGFWSVLAGADHFPVSKRRTVAIEGYGGVGQLLAQMLQGRGFNLTALSNHLGAVVNDQGLDLAVVAEAKRQHGSAWVLAKGPWENAGREAVFMAGADILVPGARVHCIDRDLASRLQAGVIIPVANVPCTPDALAELDRRRIAYLPDFVVGGGGACGWIQSVDDSFGEAYRDMFARMLRASQARGVSPRQLCEEVAHEGFETISSKAYARVPLGQKVLKTAQRLSPFNSWHASSESAAVRKARTQRLRLLFNDAV